MRTLITTTTMLALSLGTMASAQDLAKDEYLLNKIYTPPGPVAIDGGVSPANRYVAPDDPFVTDYVLARPVASDYFDDVNLAVGGRINDEIRIHDVPTTGYGYAMVNGVTVLVDKDRQRIVRVFPSL